jgi:predicted TPR repeat methyltransferase
MDNTEGPASLTPIVYTRPQALGALQAHLGDQAKDAQTWHSLGSTLVTEGRYEEAAAAAHAALTLSPHNVGVEGTYAAALGALGAVGEAAELLEDVIHRNPGDGWAYYHLGTLRYRQGDYEQARQLWECAVRLLEDPLDCLESLATMHRRQGDVSGERHCWERAAEHDPANPIASHMLAAVGLRPAPPRADGAYVASLFDRFAPDFDRVLAQLDYRVPALCRDWMQGRFGRPARGLRVLDAGCGTGLCGEQLRPWAGELIGVDLSPNMLELATRREVYDRLERADLVEFLHANPGGFDVVFAGDVLCYFGDLRTFARPAIECLRRNGWVGFSVERAGDNGRKNGAVSAYRLQNHGRYAHTRQHLRNAFKRAELHISEVVLRLELGQPVNGYLASAKRGRGR